MRHPCLLTLSLLALAPVASVRAQTPAPPPSSRATTPDESWSEPSSLSHPEAPEPRPAPGSSSRPEAPKSRTPPGSGPSRSPPPEADASQGQEPPAGDEGWDAFPGASAPVDTPLPATPRDAPPRPSGEAPPLGEPPPPARRGRPPRPPRPLLTPNRYGLYGGRSLGAGHLGVGMELGFPFVSARGVYGVLERLDLGLGVDTVYGLMTEVRASARLTLLDGQNASLAFVTDGGHAFFLRPPDTEEHGARYLSGRRDWNVAPGLVGSFQGSSPRAWRPYLDVRCLLAFDTHPVLRDPLGGVPPSWELDVSVLVRVGAEFPVGEKTSYAVSFGGDFRDRPGEAEFMPTLSVGVVSTVF
ncbi:hypothetical protein [Corallococcus sp. Z5C101001]|uniref:hypothetical protein n=1 Tax=Corallococcus sp. Z5C101001 TaxID=2596829 RepID=UPI00117FC55B|nr:hypothetical protein [Corallococcus sp. Z5C101001]TSC33744.1 hypothetical protein FOF48_01450 [Corallococcus sp. Z5C101001]